MLSENKGTPVVLTITPEEFQQMQSAVLDGDAGEALRLLKKFVKHLKEQKNRGLKSHLGRAASVRLPHSGTLRL